MSCELYWALVSTIKIGQLEETLLHLSVNQELLAHHFLLAGDPPAQEKLPT